MKFITISKTSGKMNTHQRENATSMYPLMPTLVVNTHLSISRRYFPLEIGVKYGTQKEPVGSVLDAFRGHFYKKVKAHNANYPFLKWLMMYGGITPKAQPLEILINKVFKGWAFGVIPPSIMSHLRNG